MRPGPWLALPLWLAGAACETTRSTVPPAAAFDLARAEATRGWRIVADGEPVGELVRFDDVAGERFFYSVRNPLHQELGIIDAAGRAYRYRPHEPEPSWLTTGTVRDGLRAILGTEQAPELVEVPLAELGRTPAR